MDCTARRRKNSIASEEEARKMSRISWIQDPQGMSQQQQLLDHHMILRLQQQQQQQHQQPSDQISNSALSLQQRAMAAIALQEIRSSIDPSKMVQQHHKYQQLINPGTPPPPPPAATAATMTMANKTTVSHTSITSSNNAPGTPPSPAQTHTLQSLQSVHQSIQQQQNPSFTTNPLSILDTRPLYSPMLPIAPLVSSSISSTSIEALDPIPVPVPLVSSSSKMMMPSSQLMMANIPPVIFPPSLVTSSSTSAAAAASSPIVVPSTPPPPKPVVVSKSCLSPMRNMVPDFKDLQQQQQALKSSPCSTSKWFSASPVPPSLQELRGQTFQGGSGGWLGVDCVTVNPASLDHHQPQQQHQQQLHNHHHHQQDLENMILPQDHPVASTTGCFNVAGVPLGSSGLMMPPSGNFRSSSHQQQRNMTNTSNTATNHRSGTSPVDQVIADLKNIVSSSLPDNCLVVENSSNQLKSVQAHQQQQPQQHQHHPRQRTFTKVYKLGSIGRAVDVARFKNYVELRAELSRMFGLDGQLDQRNGWQLVFVDKENDLLLVGDDPWEEFVSSVRGIRILSPSEVSYYTSEERSVEAA